MDKIQKLSESECRIPSSEPYADLSDFDSLLNK